VYPLLSCYGFLVGLWQALEKGRAPFESEINDEIDDQYDRLNPSDKSAADAVEEDDDIDTRIEDLEARLEAKLTASNNALQSKIEAMFRQLMARKSSCTDTTLPQTKDAPLPATPVSVQVTSTPAAITEPRRAPSPNHGASGVSQTSLPRDDEVGAAEEVGGGQSMEEGKGGGTVEGEAAVTAPVAEPVHQEDPYAVEQTTPSAE
jgi:hypothetical protein